jgi:hypothetical protein
VERLNRRQLRALEELEKRCVLNFSTLPTGVSLGMMQTLKEAGLIERLNNGVGPYSKHVGWQRKSSWQLILLI